MQNNAVTSTVYKYGNDSYLLRHTADGSVQLYSQLGHDDSLTDDIFTLVPEDEAPTIAREIGTVYKGLTEQYDGVIDIWSEFESVRSDEPVVMQYEGISGIMADTQSLSYYMIADNVQTEINNQWDASPQTADAGYADWTRALESMAAGQYDSHPTGLTQGMPLDDMTTSGFFTWLSIVGALSGFGALGGAGYSITSSRRRFNRELNM